MLALVGPLSLHRALEEGRAPLRYNRDRAHRARADTGRDWRLLREDLVLGLTGERLRIFGMIQWDAMPATRRARAVSKNSFPQCRSVPTVF